MAREYERTGANSGSYSLNSSTPVTTTPLSIAGWFYLKGNAYGVYQIVGVADSDTDVNYFSMAVTPNEIPAAVRAYTRSSAGTTYAATTTNVALNHWHHGCAVFNDADARSVYLDGGGKGINSSLQTPSGIDRLAVGCLPRNTLPTQPWEGYLAEVAIWNVALEDNEVVQLAAGYSALFIRPSCLVCYWPLIRKGSDIDNPDVVGCYNATDYNGPSDAVHCRMIYSAPPLLIGSKAIKQPSALLIRAIEKY